MFFSFFFFKRKKMEREIFISENKDRKFKINIKKGEQKEYIRKIRKRKEC